MFVQSEKVLVTVQTQNQQQMDTLTRAIDSVQVTGSGGTGRVILGAIEATASRVIDIENPTLATVPTVVPTLNLLDDIFFDDINKEWTLRYRSARFDGTQKINNYKRHLYASKNGQVETGDTHNPCLAQGVDNAACIESMKARYVMTQNALPDADTMTIDLDNTNIQVMLDPVVNSAEQILSIIIPHATIYNQLAKREAYTHPVDGERVQYSFGIGMLFTGVANNVVMFDNFHLIETSNQLVTVDKSNSYSIARHVSFWTSQVVGHPDIYIATVEYTLDNGHVLVSLDSTVNDREIADDCASMSAKIAGMNSSVCLTRYKLCSPVVYTTGSGSNLQTWATIVLPVVLQAGEMEVKVNTLLTTNDTRISEGVAATTPVLYTVLRTSNDGGITKFEMDQEVVLTVGQQVIVDWSATSATNPNHPWQISLRPQDPFENPPEHLVTQQVDETNYKTTVTVHSTGTALYYTCPRNHGFSGVLITVLPAKQPPPVTALSTLNFATRQPPQQVCSDVQVKSFDPVSYTTADLYRGSAVAFSENVASSAYFSVHNETGDTALSMAESLLTLVLRPKDTAALDYLTRFSLEKIRLDDLYMSHASVEGVLPSVVRNTMHSVAMGRSEITLDPQLLAACPLEAEGGSWAYEPGFGVGADCVTTRDWSRGAESRYASAPAGMYFVYRVDTATDTEAITWLESTITGTSYAGAQAATEIHTRTLSRVAPEYDGHAVVYWMWPVYYWPDASPVGLKDRTLISLSWSLTQASTIHRRRLLTDSSDSNVHNLVKQDKPKIKEAINDKMNRLRQKFKQHSPQRLLDRLKHVKAPTHAHLQTKSKPKMVYERFK